MQSLGLNLSFVFKTASTVWFVVVSAAYTYLVADGVPTFLAFFQKWAKMAKIFEKMVHFVQFLNNSPKYSKNFIKFCQNFSKKILKFLASPKFFSQTTINWQFLSEKLPQSFVIRWTIFFTDVYQFLYRQNNVSPTATKFVQNPKNWQKMCIDDC